MNKFLLKIQNLIVKGNEKEILKNTVGRKFPNLGRVCNVIESFLGIPILDCIKIVGFREHDGRIIGSR